MARQGDNLYDSVQGPRLTKEQVQQELEALEANLEVWRTRQAQAQSLVDSSLWDFVSSALTGEMEGASKVLVSSRDQIEVSRAQGKYKALMDLQNGILALANDGVVDRENGVTIKDMEEAYEDLTNREDE